MAYSYLYNNNVALSNPVSLTHISPYSVAYLAYAPLALSLGVPIVTMPSAHLGGRLALALLRQLGYGFGNETRASSEVSPEARASEETSGSGDEADSDEASNSSSDEERVDVDVVMMGEADQPPSTTPPTITITTSTSPHQGSSHSTGSTGGIGGTGGGGGASSGPVNTKLVVSSSAEYVTTAMAIAHNPKLRAHHTR